MPVARLVLTNENFVKKEFRERDGVHIMHTQVEGEGNLFSHALIGMKSSAGDTRKSSTCPSALGLFGVSTS
jgi:hypothetical protein